MAFFDKLGEMTKIVSEKANDSLATNNLIAEINLTKGNIQALQRELGEHYWAKFAVGEKLDDEAMFICDKIVLAHDKIKLLENQIEQIKAEGEARKAERAAAKAEQKAAEEAEKAAEKVEEAEKAAEKAGIERPVCTGCGADLTEGVKFCGQCGTPVEAAEPVEGVVE